ncbi:MAG: Ig-like domain-containing protein, partial [Spirochaetes bacterium]|nr:Ig-like domain-containing protein [Spirochaetota bacterium]
MVWVDISGIFSKDIYNITVSTNVEDLNYNQLEGPPNNTVSFAGQAAYISNTVATSNTGVRVYFSDEVEQAGAETAGNYSIPGLTVTGATRDLVDFSLVDLTTLPQEDINYTLTVTVVIDQDSRQFGGDVEPYIQNVYSYSNTEVVVYFSEAVEIASAENLTNYSIPGLTIISATRDAADFSKINLDTGSQGDGTIYTLTINNVTDLNWNSILNPGTMGFTGTGVTDNTSPRVLSAVIVDGDTVEVQFSEPVDQASSETAGNYTITDNVGNSVSVTAASRQADISKVRLDTAGTFSEFLYSLEVSASVEDTGFNPMAGPPDNTVSFAGQGTIPKSFNDGPVLVDPIGEGSNNFSMLAKYRGRIYLGPANADNAVFRFKPDGSYPEIVSFSFHVGATYTTSLNPGPDNEDGIDYITGGIINGKEYLFIGPSSSNSIDYIYFTTEGGNTLDFNPMDLSAVLGPNTRGVSSMI